MKNMEDESVNIIVTDPPYLINYSRHDKNSRFSKPIKNDDNPQLIKEYINECYRILKNNSAMYMFTNYKTVDFFKQELEKCGFHRYSFVQYAQIQSILSSKKWLKININCAYCIVQFLRF